MSVLGQERSGSSFAEHFLHSFGNRLMRRSERRVEKYCKAAAPVVVDVWQEKLQQPPVASFLLLFDSGSMRTR